MLGRVLREPLLRFLLIGSVVFAVFTLMNPDEAPEVDVKAIVITRAQAEQLSAQFQQTWRRLPGEQEMSALIDALVREEILVREAETLSLDRGDTVIRRRLAQKMEFILTSAARARPPTEEELAAFYEENAGRYSVEGQVAFEQVFLGEAPDEASQNEALSLLANGVDPATIGRPSLLPPEIGAAGQRAADGTFGTGFFDQLMSLDGEIGEWTGPVRSGFGVHAVRLLERTETTSPPLEAIRSMVEADWSAAESEVLAAELFAEISGTYDIVKPAPGELEGLLQ